MKETGPVQSVTVSGAALAGTVKALLFDVFGTVVDWRSSLIADFAAWGKARGIEADWERLIDDWRGKYASSMDQTRGGDWKSLDDLHRASLEKITAEMAIEGLSEADLDYLTKGWHRLRGWPDSAAGLERLKTKFIIAPLSNGNIALLVNMAKFAGLPWDVIFSAEHVRKYKPHPETYLTACEMLSLSPRQVMMLAAHNYDLAAARSLGLKTAFIPRPQEYGPRQNKDFGPEQDWDIAAADIVDLARQLSC